jgi:hypothetical protein
MNTSPPSLLHREQALHENGGHLHLIDVHFPLIADDRNLASTHELWHLIPSARLVRQNAPLSHESPRTRKLYDRRQDEISLDEIEAGLRSEKRDNHLP